MRVTILSLMASALVLAGCGRSERTDNMAVDINAAADRAKGDIATYAASSALKSREEEATREAVAAARPEQPEPAASPAPDAAPDGSTPAATVSLAADNPEAAAEVVRRYYAAIGKGAFAEARALCGDDGRDSGMDTQALADTFARYRDYHVDIGMPGRVDAGAGQRYVTVPVTITGRLTNGRPDNRSGDVVLHRVADIDGATAEQKQWRIRSIDLKPAPAPQGME